MLDGAGGCDGLLVALDPVGKAEGDFVGSGASVCGGAEAEIGLSGLSGEPDADRVSAVCPVVAPVPGELPSVDEQGAPVVFVGVLVVWVPWVVEHELEVSVLLGISHESALCCVVWVLPAEEVVLLVGWVDSDSLDCGFTVTAAGDDFATASGNNEIIIGSGRNCVLASVVLNDLEVVGSARHDVVSESGVDVIIVAEKRKCGAFNIIVDLLSVDIVTVVVDQQVFLCVLTLAANAVERADAVAGVLTALVADVPVVVLHVDEESPLVGVLRIWRKAGKILFSHLIWSPWVFWVVIKFKYNIRVFISGAFIDAFNLKWAAEVALDVDNLAAEHHEVVGIASVAEDESLDSLLLSLERSVGVVLGVGSVEGANVVFAAWDGVVAVHVDGGGGV